MATTTSTITARLTDALYTEAMLLADELRAYHDGPGAAARAALSPRTRVLFACEALNASTRLMQVTARLLARRAGGGGERLEAATPAPPEVLALLPEEARRLVADSHDLHDRVRRLEAGHGAVPPPFSPAHALLHRLERAF